MKDIPKTSEFLLSHLRGDDLEPPEHRLSPQEEKEFEAVLSLITASVEVLLPVKLEDAIYQLRGAGRELEWWLDDLLCRKFLKEIPKIVSRARRLEPVLVKRLPSKPVSVYLREAVRSYVHGLFQASVALSRSAVEHALRERMGSTDDLVNLVKGAHKMKLLEGDLLQYANDIKTLHAGPVNHDGAFDVLVKARKVLEVLYS